MSKELKNRGQNIAERRGREVISPRDVGHWMMDASDEMDLNKQQLEYQIKQAELDRTNNKGTFGTLDSLKTQYPKADNKKEWYAFVGTDNPRERYHVKADGGDWLATGDFQNVGEVDLAEYAKNGGSNQTLKQVDDNSTRNCALITNSSYFISIDTKKEEISFSSASKFSIYHGRRWFGGALLQDQTLSYRIEGHEFVQIKYDIENKMFVIDNINSVGDFVVIGYIIITGNPQITLFTNLYSQDGIAISSNQLLSIKAKYGLDILRPLRSAESRALQHIKHIHFTDCNKDVKISYFGNTESSPNGIRLRDTATNDSLLLKTNLESNKLYTFELDGGGFVDIMLDFSELALGEFYVNSSEWALFYDRSKFVYTTPKTGDYKYPWDNSSKNINIDALKNAIKDIHIIGAQPDKYYTLWVDTKTGYPAQFVKYRIQLVESDTAEYVAGVSQFKGILEYYVNNDDVLKDEFVECRLSVVQPTEVSCRFLINASLLPILDLKGSNGAYSQSQFKFHKDVFKGGRFFEKEIRPNTVGVGFEPFILQDFDNKWMCNVLENGFDADKQFALDSWDNNTFVNSVYEPLRQRHARFITRSANPIYSIVDGKGVTQKCHLYEFTPEHYAHTVFINTGTHCRESEGWLGVAKMLQLIYDHWQDNDILRYLRFNVRFIVVPVLNIWGLSNYPRENDLNGNNVNLNRNWDNRWTKSGWGDFENVAGSKPFSEIETQSVNEILIARKSEIDFIADVHTTVWSSFGDYSLDYGTSHLWGQLTNVQKSAVGYLLTKNVIVEDKRILSDGRKPNIPFNPYFGANIYAMSSLLSSYARDKLNIQASTVEHSDFVWSDKRGTSSALKAAVEWFTNFFYNVARNL